MLSRGMAISRIGIGATPGQDGDAINDEIAGTNEPAAQRGENGEDKQRFRQWCPCTIPALPLLRRARNAGTTIPPKRQAARQGQGRPITQPVMHILIRKPPECAQERDEQQRLLAIRARCATGACW